MAGFTDEEIENLLNNPRRVRGDQGEIEERSVDEVIKADQYRRKRGRSRHNILMGSVLRVTPYEGGTD